MTKHIYKPPLQLALLTTGVVLIVVGAYSILQPWQSFTYFVKYTGLTLVMSSVILLWYALSRHVHLSESKWLAAESLIDLAFATVLLFNPFLTAVAFPLIIGSWLVIRGGLKVLLSLLNSQEIGGWRNILVVGIVSVLFGLIFIIYPYGRIREVGFRISIFAILMGALYIYDALRAKRSDETLIGIL